MSDPNPQETDISDEIRNLGKNLNLFIRAAWASPERQLVQREIELSLTEVGDTLNKAANEFAQSEPGKQLKSDLHDINTSIENGKLQEKAQNELLGALRKVNSELEKAANHWSDKEKGSSGTSKGSSD